jgi:hypothetical protein
VYDYAVTWRVYDSASNVAGIRRCSKVAGVRLCANVAGVRLCANVAGVLTLITTRSPEENSGDLVLLVRSRSRLRQRFDVEEEFEATSLLHAEQELEVHTLSRR